MPDLTLPSAQDPVGGNPYSMDRMVKQASAPPSPPPQTPSWSDTIWGALGGLFGKAPPNSTYLGDAPKMGYPTGEGGVPAAYGSGYEGIIQSARVRDATGLRGDLDAIAQRLSTTKVKPMPDAAKMLAQAVLASHRNAITGLGFDPSTLAMENSGEALTIGGFYDPDRDVMMVSAADPSALAHESTHRGLKVLRNSGVLSLEESALLDRSEESVVRYIMKKDMGDVEGGGGDIDKQQREDAIYLFEKSASTNNFRLLSSIEKKAEALYAQRHMAGPH